MKAISLHQPYASLIAAGLKRIESSISRWSPIQASSMRRQSTSRATATIAPSGSSRGSKSSANNRGCSSWIRRMDSRPVAFVRGRLRLAQLVPDARAAFERGDLVLGVALLVAGLPAEQQPAALAFALEPAWDDGKKTVRQLARWIEEQSLDLSRAAWPLEDESLVPEAGACARCPKRTGAQEGLFVGAVAGDRCLDRACWDRKLNTHVKALKRAGDLLEISEDYGSCVKRADAPLPRGCYAPIEPDALVSKGRDKGQVRRVCAEPTCSVHGKEIDAPKLKKAEQARQRDWEAERKAQEEKDRREAKVRAAVLKAAIEAVSLDRGHLQHAELLLLARGRDRWGLDQIKDGLDWSRIPKADDLELEDLSRFLLVQHFAGEAAFGHGDARGLLAFAKRVGVDVAAIRKQALEETKAAKPAAAKAKKKTPAKKKAGKGRK